MKMEKKTYQYSRLFPLKDMQNPPPLRSGGNFIKVAKCAEQNEKNNKKNLRFELSSKIGMMTSQKWPSLEK